MKHAELRAIVHNVADSLSSGVSLLIGCYELDIYAEAAAAPNGQLTIDFLHGQADMPISQQLRDALPLFRNALQQRCEQAGGAITEMRVAQSRYWSDRLSHRFTITVEDRCGRWSETDYAGIPGKRLQQLDPLGRRRRTPIRHRRATGAT